MLKKILTKNLAFLANSKYQLPSESVETLRDDGLVRGMEVLFLPDSDLWSSYCSTRFMFQLFGKKKLSGVVSFLRQFDGLKLAFVVHKRRVLFPACATMSLLNEEGLTDWSSQRILVLGDHTTNSEIAQACRVHGVPLGIIATSGYDGMDSYAEIRRLFTQ